MGNNKNKNLFWYGFFANVKKFFGGIGLVFGGIMSLVGWAGNSNGTLFIGIILLVGGLYLLFTGSSERFDYQRQSGNIIHKGDW